MLMSLKLPSGRYRQKPTVRDSENKITHIPWIACTNTIQTEVTGVPEEAAHDTVTFIPNALLPSRKPEACSNIRRMFFPRHLQKREKNEIKDNWPQGNGPDTCVMKNCSLPNVKIGSCHVKQSIQVVQTVDTS